MLGCIPQLVLQWWLGEVGVELYDVDLEDKRFESCAGLHITQGMAIGKAKEAASEVSLLTSFELARRKPCSEIVDREILNNLVGVDAWENALPGIERCVIDGEESAVVGKADVEKLCKASTFLLTNCSKNIYSPKHYHLSFQSTVHSIPWTCPGTGTDIPGS